MNDKLPDFSFQFEKSLVDRSTNSNWFSAGLSSKKINIVNIYTKLNLCEQTLIFYLDFPFLDS